MSRPKPEDRLRTLRKRRDHLAERVAGTSRDELSFDREELAALNWAVRVLERAVALGMLADLERTAA